VRAACEWVVERAEDVGLGPLDRALAAVRERPVPAWDRRRHYSGEHGVAYILVLDTVNFSFWGSPATGGYWRLAEGLRDAFLAGPELADPGRLASLEAPELARWTGELALLEERAAALRELGARAQRVGGLEALVQDGAAATAGYLADNLASYADVATYQGRAVPLLKRAQIVPADLAGAGLRDFADLDSLTCFADYKLPQALRQVGALRYSERLARRVDDWRELAPGEPAEVEIRATTVVAVERLRDALAAAGRALRSFELDWILWGLAQELHPVRPYHRTRTIFY
jgi:putative queuosine salvage protein